MRFRFNLGLPRAPSRAACPVPDCRSRRARPCAPPKSYGFRAIWGISGHLSQPSFCSAVDRVVNSRGSGANLPLNFSRLRWGLPRAAARTACPAADSGSRGKHPCAPPCEPNCGRPPTPLSHSSVFDTIWVFRGPLRTPPARCRIAVHGGRASARPRNLMSSGRFGEYPVIFFSAADRVINSRGVRCKPSFELKPIVGDPRPRCRILPFSIQFGYSAGPFARRLPGAGLPFTGGAPVRAPETLWVQGDLGNIRSFIPAIILQRRRQGRQFQGVRCKPSLEFFSIALGFSTGCSPHRPPSRGFWIKGGAPLCAPEILL